MSGQKRSWDVATWKITYNWKGNVPSGKYAQTLPTDSKTYINGEQYTVDDKFKDGTTVETTDDFGNVNGVYTFHGWNHQTGETITSDLTLKVHGALRPRRWMLIMSPTIGRACRVSSYMIRTETK